MWINSKKDILNLLLVNHKLLQISLFPKFNKDIFILILVNLKLYRDDLNLKQLINNKIRICIIIIDK